MDARCAPAMCPGRGRGRGHLRIRGRPAAAERGPGEHQGRHAVSGTDALGEGRSAHLRLARGERRAWAQVLQRHPRRLHRASRPHCQLAAVHGAGSRPAHLRERDHMMSELNRDSYETSTGQEQAYLNELLLALRMRGVPGPRIAEAVAEVSAHLSETGETPQEAFGPAQAYAGEVAAALG